MRERGISRAAAYRAMKADPTLLNVQKDTVVVGVDLAQPFRFVTQHEFDALVVRVEKLEAKPNTEFPVKYGQALKAKEGQRHPTLGERSSKNELPRRYDGRRTA